MDEKTTKQKAIKSEDPKEAWESGLRILKNMYVYIPIKLLLVCNRIADGLRDEFSIVTNIAQKDKTDLVLSEDYYIPKQEVSESHINYLPDEYKFNTVIHRHPDGCNNFSSTDQAFINQNFELSILYTKREGFINGLYNLRHESGYLIQLPVEIFVEDGLEDINTTNIVKPAPLMIIEKSRKSKSKRDMRLRDLSKRDWDLEPDHINPMEINPEREKLFPEESMDYELMRSFMLEEVNVALDEHEYRINNLEETVLHSTGTHGPF